MQITLILCLCRSGDNTRRGMLKSIWVDAKELRIGVQTVVQRILAWKKKSVHVQTVSVEQTRGAGNKWKKRPTKMVGGNRKKKRLETVSKSG